MMDSTDFSALRRRNTEILVTRAFSLLVPREHNTPDQREPWIERLLAGYCVQTFIQDLKKGRLVADQVSAKESLPAKQLVGEMRVIDENLTLHAGLRRELMVSIENFSDRLFQTTGKEPLFASYHWYYANGEAYQFDGERTALTQSIAPFRKTEMPMVLTPPAKPGEYELIATMVYEGRCWMEDAGLRVHRLNLTVQDFDGSKLSRHALTVFKQLQAAEAKVGI